jgi:hypothetical protein
MTPLLAAAFPLTRYSNSKFFRAAARAVGEDADID